MGVQSFDERVLSSQNALFDNAQGTTESVLIQGATYGARMDVCLASNSDVIDHVVQLQFYSNGERFTIGSVNVPAGQGFAGTLAIDLIAVLLPVSAASFPIPSGCAIYAQLEVSATVAGSVNVASVGGLL